MDVAPNFANASELAGREEPTVLTDVVRLLRVSAEGQEAWKDIRLHAQHCLQEAGASDVSVCLEVCPETWKEKDPAVARARLLEVEWPGSQGEQPRRLGIPGRCPCAAVHDWRAECAGEWAMFMGGVSVLLHCGQGRGRVQRGDEGTLQGVLGAAELVP